MRPPSAGKNWTGGEARRWREMGAAGLSGAGPPIHDVNQQGGLAAIAPYIA